MSRTGTQDNNFLFPFLNFDTHSLKSTRLGSWPFYPKQVFSIQTGPKKQKNQKRGGEEPPHRARSPWPKAPAKPLSQLRNLNLLRVVTLLQIYFTFFQKWAGQKWLFALQSLNKIWKSSGPLLISIKIKSSFTSLRIFLLRTSSMSSWLIISFWYK